MKKITTLISTVIFTALSTTLDAQVLNQSANWPDTNWTVGGTYNPAGLLNNPTINSSFSFDDDAAGNSSFDVSFAASPIIDLTPAQVAGETMINISGTVVYRPLGGDSLTIDYWDDDALTWNTIEVFAGNSTTTDYQTCLGLLPYTTGFLNIAGFTPTQLAGFRYRINYNDNAGWQWGFCISSPTITSSVPPSCPDPTTLMANNITATSADLGWTENGFATNWNIEWGTAGFTLGTGTMVSDTVNPYSLTGLSASTSYDFYIQADCGGDSSAWVGPYSFTTPCVASAISSFPWTENFDGETVPNLPCGWLAENVNADANTWISTTTQSSSAPNALAVTYNATIATDDWAFTPNLTLTGGQAYQLSFKYRAESATYPEKLKVMYGSAQNSASMTTMLFDSTNIINTTFNTASVIFTPPTTASYFIGFHGYSDANMWRLYVDDVTVDISTNVNTEVGNKGFTVYPNPNHGLFTVATPKGEKATIEILNVQGKVIYKNTMNGSNQNIDLTNNAKGIYFVNITTAKGVEIQKIVIQ